MNKERIEIIFTPDKDSPKMITVKAPDFNGSEESLNHLEEKIRKVRKDYPDILIQARTPQMNGPQVEILFAAGANAFTIIPQEEEVNT